MLENHVLLDKLKDLIEQELGWGDSIAWTNQDFLNLSEKIRTKTEGTLSHVTLKRIWGKVKYNSLPNTYTLNTLAQYAGYQGWRDFAATMDSSPNTPGVTKPDKIENSSSKRKAILFTAAGIILILAFFLTGFFQWISRNAGTEDAGNYRFSSKKVVTSGVPNSVIFDLDATAAPTDSVVIQQSWDKTRNAKLSKNERKHTSIYYLPDFYKAKLLVNDKIVKEHNLFIKSDGWLTAVLLSPVPAYIKQEEVIHDGKMSLPAELIRAQNISLLPKAPTVLYTNVKDFGPVYSDDFIFETALKNDYKAAASVCQQTNIYLLCEGTAIRIPLCNKGCVSDIGLLFTNYQASGKKNDLSSFGVDFGSFIKVKLVSKNGTARVFLNDSLVYTIDKNIVKAKIIGINYYFEGTGSVDYVRLGNEKIMFKDDFGN